MEEGYQVLHNVTQFPCYKTCYLIYCRLGIKILGCHQSLLLYMRVPAFTWHELYHLRFAHYVT